ncbi:unnamed protein product [Acanthosepion pharaonis]|uniref:Uncharacterized protein n=1 Tax=Acanthosepion pharaonis TaxID=158019 RepID=A0A812CZC4_ACAPH|nr:unnamed protein product [Sepia pharaonis]
MRTRFEGRCRYRRPRSRDGCRRPASVSLRRRRGHVYGPGRRQCPRQNCGGCRSASLLWTATVSVARATTRPPCFSSHTFLTCHEKTYNKNKTLDGGSLGSSVDEERGQPRKLMRIAGLSEHRHLERTLRPRDPLSRGPVRSRAGKWHVFSLDSREASHRPTRRSFFMKELPVSYAKETGTSQEEPASLLPLRLPLEDRGVASLTTASSRRLQDVEE